MALYEAGDYSGAAQRFAESSDAHAHYNRGNALAKSGELEAALDAYDQALERQPDLRPAQTNKALVESLLKQKNAPPPVEPQKSADDETKDTEQETPPGAATQPADNNPPKSDAGQTTPDAGQQATTPPKPGANEVPGSELGDEQSTTPPMRPASDNIDGEQRQALEQWLRKIPDDPGELLRRKFWYEQQQHQDQGKIR